MTSFILQPLHTPVLPWENADLNVWFTTHVIVHVCSMILATSLVTLPHQHCPLWFADSQLICALLYMESGWFISQKLQTAKIRGCSSPELQITLRSLDLISLFIAKATLCLILYIFLLTVLFSIICNVFIRKVFLLAYRLLTLPQYYVEI